MKGNRLMLGICLTWLCDSAAHSDYFGAFVDRCRFHLRHLPSLSAVNTGVKGGQKFRFESAPA